MRPIIIGIAALLLGTPVSAAEIEDYVGSWKGIGEGEVTADVRRGTSKPEWLVIELGTGTEGCAGGVTVYGRVSPDGSVRAESDEPESDGLDICRIELDLVGRQALRVDEVEGCMWAHGFSCSFSGNLTPVRRRR